MRAFILYVYSICAVSETIDLCYILSVIIYVLLRLAHNILYSSELLFIYSKIQESCFMEKIIC